MKEKIYGEINKVVYYNEESGFGVVSLKINFKNKGEKNEKKTSG